MRLGVFGGSFDPVHYGHLILAENSREAARLDLVLFVPAPRPPHKLDREQTPFFRRVEMLELAIAGHPAFQVSQIEKDRPGPSFTVDTLTQLQAERPEAELFLLLGSDSLQDFPLWYQPERIAELATLVVTLRPGAEKPTNLPSHFRVLWVDAPRIDISSTDIRNRVRTGRTIRYLLPRAVECYIETHRLYRD
ncbi:MAG: nicotinate-nucleotide adenylyltransferase [Gemmatales bacterium]|nr:nicotinate-nucleotide adenylyltransferase [Gemmatales bacterium]MDW8386235.1 nicotinate-nucleotide adenylyltransferase [Gemmatales bacterium]